MNVEHLNQCQTDALPKNFNIHSKSRRKNKTTQQKHQEQTNKKRAQMQMSASCASYQKLVHIFLDLFRFSVANGIVPYYIKCTHKNKISAKSLRAQKKECRLSLIPLINAAFLIQREASERASDRTKKDENRTTPST